MDEYAARTRDISIHAPRKGSDRKRAQGRQASQISIHAPREGSDGQDKLSILGLALFLSTLPARGATGKRHHRKRTIRYFYPRSPRGERPSELRAKRSCYLFLSTLPARGATAAKEAPDDESRISIHAPREGSDVETSTKGG